MILKTEPVLALHLVQAIEREAYAQQETLHIQRRIDQLELIAMLLTSGDPELVPLGFEEWEDYNG